MFTLLMHLQLIEIGHAQLGHCFSCASCALLQEPEDLLNGWANNISRLLDLVEKSCQQISKECMIHKVQLNAVQ